ncbi:peptidoglycan/xylan/chitin deacetylase (PgdA/CDA1 family) [Virgibacillus natechei]|uniref:Peptidoglycan/xylan/chitin deacetylase (PgdA/CDA1 family) n=1 Tax=Virgibacillus natechei TaxID=1216297 RepID=A0ABS4IJJ0_9BACI|nr:polysaccharide deacetylase family protein [Virgibacillus natechei]MBP1970521.1 peptidoglycan/xylan/chitin deacetylase (PgdA/CDA1 family) [Virgibacillus natechei]UZD14076.1 polysaccharide deacetylase family protein [Virgibacillus natechei]
MQFKIRSYHILCIIALFLFISACGQEEQTQPNVIHDQPNTLLPMQFQPDQEDEQEFVQDPPKLDGGPEKIIREPNPVSNEKLADEYPDILVLRGSPDDDRVALTFDDGPDPRFTPDVLDKLEEHDVKATFFLMGERVEANPELATRIHEEGHAIGNHTYTHPNLPEADEAVERLQSEVQDTEDVINDIIGFRPKHFRSPYGALNEELVEPLGEMNYSVVGWDVDSLDWKELGVEEISDNVLSNTVPGSIILMHDGGDVDTEEVDLSDTPRSLDEIIPQLQADGIEFVTVPELLGIPEEK